MNKTEAIKIDKEPTCEAKTPILILAFFIFKGRNTIVDRITEKFKVLSIGHNAKFQEIAEKMKRENKFNGKIETKVYSQEESDINSLLLSVRQFEQYVTTKKTETNISNIYIRIFVPEDGFCSINKLFTRYLIGQLKDVQNYKIWKGILGDPLSFSDEKIKVLEYSEMPLEGIETELNLYIDETDSSYDTPTDTDARVAAILCEYTYLLVRDYAARNMEGNILSRKFLLRDSGDLKRVSNTRDELCKLTIIPDKWKEKAIPNYGKETTKTVTTKTAVKKDTETVIAVNSAITTTNNVTNKDATKTTEEEKADCIRSLLGLNEWDAINLDYESQSGELWMGLSDHENENWEDSLTKKIIVSLSKRFSLRGNKGVLNTWFGLCRNSGFSSVIYVNERTRTVMYCTAGSDFGTDMLFNGDWTTTNFSQFLIGLSPQYQQSVTNAKILDEVISKIDKEDGKHTKLLFIGHSLGGGLASNNAIITSNRHAITFNAAGLNWLRVPISLAKNNPTQLLHPFKRKERVHLFVIKGEILDTVQSYISPTPWILNGLNLDLPGKARAYSSRSTRKEINPSVENGIPNAFKRHSLVNFLVPCSKILEITL